jgi:hypothetical protein
MYLVWNDNFLNNTLKALYHLKMNTAKLIEIITQYVCRNIATMSIIKMFHHSWAFRHIDNQRRVWYIVKECRRNVQYCRAFLLYLPAQLLICSGLCPWLCLLWSHSDSRYLNYMFIGCVHRHVSYCRRKGNMSSWNDTENWFLGESHPRPRPEKRKWPLHCDPGEAHILQSGPRRNAHVYILDLYMENTNPWICWQMLLLELYIWPVKVSFV